MEVYTYISNPFRIAGPQHDIVKTKVEEYERIDIGKGYYAIVFENKIKNLWHIAIEDCGALIMTDNNKEGGIRKVKNDVALGTRTVMQEQIARGKYEIASARFIEFETFCSNFK